MDKKYCTNCNVLLINPVVIKRYVVSNGSLELVEDEVCPDCYISEQHHTEIEKAKQEPTKRKLS